VAGGGKHGRITAATEHFVIRMGHYNQDRHE
jgi:hypothetical protein